MLRKLLRYELKATGRIFTPLFIALVMFAGITRFFASISPEQWVTPAKISMAIYIIIMVGMFVMTFVMMIQRFYKNLLSDEGYLMFTLPVNPWKHIVSKLLISMLWIVTSGITALISILIIGLKRGDLSKIMGGFASLHQQVIEQLGTSAYLLALEVFIVVVLGLALSILIVYASIAVGQLFNKHKILASFGAFIVLTTFAEIFTTLISMSPVATYFSDIFIPSHDLLGMESSRGLTIAYGGPAIAYGILLTGVLCIVYFATTNFILSKRLNLE